MKSFTLRTCLFCLWLLLFWLAGIQPATAQSYDPVADYDAGFANGSNPNGVWTYGWSNTLTSALTVYPEHRTIYTTLNAWDDPSNSNGGSPLVYKNTGGTFNGTVPSGALILYGGGQSTVAYSHLIFTAPQSGSYTVNMTFTGRQDGYIADVHVLVNGNAVFDQVLNGNGYSTTYSGTVSLQIGQPLDFVVGTNNGAGINSNSTQLNGTITPVGTYTLTDLGTLGGTISYALGINNAGQVVGYSSDSSGTLLPFYWDSLHGLNNLGLLPGGSAGFAYSISGNGRVVGEADTSHGSYAVSMGPTSSIFNLGGPYNSIANAISDSTGVVGWAEFDGVNEQAFLHISASSSITPADALAGLGGTQSIAYADNNVGQAVGYASLSNGNYHASLWQPGAQVTDLGTLGGNDSAAYGVNDFTQIAGWSSDSGGNTRAFLWDPISQSMQDLGDLGYGMVTGRAINLNGQVVGDDAGLAAFVWDPVNQIRNLNSLLDPVTGAGWTLQIARGINDPGQIVGIGTSRDGNKHAFLLTPPAALQSLGIAPGEVAGGSPAATATLNLTLPAPASGLRVSLSSDTPTVASVPSTVEVPGGQTSYSFPVTTSAPAADTLVTITATHGSDTPQAALLQVDATRSVSSVTLIPTSVNGGNSSQATVTLNQPAAPSDLTVALSSDNPLAQLVDASGNPISSVTIPYGQPSASFKVITSQTTTNATANISASLNGSSASTPLTIQAPVPQAVSFSPSNKTVGGVTPYLTGTVTISFPAPPGYQISLQSSNAAASVPANVPVQAGQTSATFTVTTFPVAADTPVTISANANGATATGTLTVTAPTPSSLTLSPNSLVGGASSTGKLTLNGAAPTGGLVVPLSNSNTAAATVPASVTVAAGQTSATFTVKTTGVATTQTTTITATYNGVSKSATLTVKPAALLGLTFTPNQVKGGTPTKLTVALNGAAPPGGAVVSLSSSNPGKLVVPASVTIPFGASSVSLTLTPKTVTSNTTVTVTGIYPNVSKSAKLTITP